VEHILKMYEPAEFCEKELTEVFINKLIKILNLYRKKNENDENQSLTLDYKNETMLNFPFKSSSVNLEAIEIPEQFGLNFLIKF
jgi:hypothetical protein